MESLFTFLFEPFEYQYMQHAMVAATLVGAACALLSCYLMLKGWSLIGDALSHSVVPGVAAAYALGLPLALGAFFSGFLAALSIAALKAFSHLREDAIIGFIFTTFFAAGLLLISLNPTSVNVQTIILGNILAVSASDQWQIVIICLTTIALIALKWRTLMLVFFDEPQASAVGINVNAVKIGFFTLLSACTVASLQTVGAILVIAMVITPGATAYLLTDRFERLLVIASAIGALSGLLGVYFSYFFDATTGAVIVVLQTVSFILAFLFSPKHGIVTAKLNRSSAIKLEEKPCKL
ncbi:metal ABC transporter permease [Vibrio sp. SCSIO 43136]|uniref:metal ABC transporter permease n=1 Tax=Vibrio sp. SCSIO 43136 TaxID=2819101 RepID=UPI002074C0C7|nr:metal ABC transporter permease [Vibrio sp. SCSIO 43136]USD67466.1 metal ABC transporter permease [Vibrio sp. SCSIO 43136]